MASGRPRALAGRRTVPESCSSRPRGLPGLIWPADSPGAPGTDLRTRPGGRAIASSRSSARPSRGQIACRRWLGRRATRPSSRASTWARPRKRPSRGAVEFDRVVPPSGNRMVAQRQCCLGPARAGQTIRFWTSVDVIHLSIAGARIHSLRSHFSSADLQRLQREGATPAGSPIRRRRDTTLASISPRGSETQ